MKAIRTRIILAVTGAVLLAGSLGCGGGGGGGSRSSSGDPAATVQSRSQAADQAQIQEDLNTYMGYISESYSDVYGDTKATLRDYMAAYFADFDVVSITILQRDYTVTSNQTVVVETATRRITDRVRESGDQATEDIQMTTEWVKEGDTWRIRSITEN